MKYRYKSVSIVPGVRTMQKLFPDYPCGREKMGCDCPSAPGRCAKMCEAWRRWFSAEWEMMRREK